MGLVTASFTFSLSQWGAPELLELVFYIIGAAIVHVAGVVLYRLYFHPLAGYPGPFLARCTTLNAAYHAWRGDSHLVLYHAHRKYGTFVRFAPNNLSINDVNAVNEIYGHGKNVQKSPFYSVMPPYPGAFDTHNIINKTQHSRKRRVMSQAFSDSALKGLEKYILTHVRTFVRLLADCEPHNSDENEQPSKNMAHLTNWFAFDVIGDLCFGKTFGMLTREEWRFWPGLIDRAIHRHAITGISLKIHKLGLGRILFPHIAGDQKKFVTYAREQAKERIALGAGSRKDLYYYLLGAKDPQTGEGYSMSELWSESNLIIAAGSHTPAMAMAAAFYFLANYPKVLAELTSVVRSSFSNIEDIQSSNFTTPRGQLAYRLTRACVDEAMRIAPPVPTTLPRRVLNGGITVAGRCFPEGVDIAIPIFTLQMNEKYFPDPFTYKPDRFLVEKAESREAYERAQSAFIPFSHGVRSCVGRSFAYLELILGIARTVWLYDFECLGGGRETRFDNMKFVEELGGGKYPVIYRIDDHHTGFGSREGPNIRFTRRSDIE